MNASNARRIDTRIRTTHVVPPSRAVTFVDPERDLSEALDLPGDSRNEVAMLQIDLTGKTALIAAAERGDSGMLRLLLDHKGDPDHQDRQGETALIKAARIGDLQSVSVLLSAGQNVNATDYAGHTALWHAMEARNTKIVQLIQTAGGS